MVAHARPTLFENRHAVALANKNAIREEPSLLFERRTIPTLFQQFVDSRIIPSLVPPKKKIEYWQLLTRHCVHNAVNASLINHCVAQSRDRAVTEPLLITCWDKLVEGGWVEKATGSEASKMVTRYVAAPKLLGCHKEWKAEMLDEITNDVPDLIVLKKTEGAQVTRVSIWEHLRFLYGVNAKDTSGFAYCTEMEGYISRINENNLAHAWVAYRLTEGSDGNPTHVAFPPSIVLRQIHSEKINRMTRLYTGFPRSTQNMPKAQRATITIDGSPTVELDFSCFNIRMLYHSERLDPKGDLYRPETIFPRWYAGSPRTEHKKRVRDLVKEATNATFNTSSRGEAIGAVHDIIKKCPRYVRDVVYSIEGSGESNLLTRIEAAHPELVKAGKFYPGTDGQWDVMTVGGRIMLYILLRFADAKKPALGVHDSVIVKAEDAKLARRVMTEVYVEFKGCKPVIK